MSDVRFVVWQFVRLMVQLEKEAGRGRRKGARGPDVYRDWREAWEELDARLTDLGQNDAAAYADLMMEQEVVLPLRGQAQRAQVTAALDRVIRQLSDAIARKQGPLKDLRFEQRELTVLRRDLEAE